MWVLSEHRNSLAIELHCALVLGVIDKLLELFRQLRKKFKLLQQSSDTNKLVDLQFINWEWSKLKNTKVDILSTNNYITANIYILYMHYVSNHRHYFSWWDDTLLGSLPWYAFHPAMHPNQQKMLISCPSFFWKRKKNCEFWIRFLSMPDHLTDSISSSMASTLVFIRLMVSVADINLL